MNVTTLKKKHPAYIKSDWKLHKSTIEKLSIDKAVVLLNVIADFKSKKSVTEIAIIKYEKLPIYITVKYADYPELLAILNKTFLKKEDYENCSIIQSIINEHLTQ